MMLPPPCFTSGTEVELHLETLDLFVVARLIQTHKNTCRLKEEDAYKHVSLHPSSKISSHPGHTRTPTALLNPSHSQTQSHPTGPIHHPLAIVMSPNPSLVRPALSKRLAHSTPRPRPYSFFPKSSMVEKVGASGCVHPAITSDPQLLCGHLGNLTLSPSSLSKAESFIVRSTYVSQMWPHHSLMIHRNLSKSLKA